MSKKRNRDPLSDHLANKTRSEGIQTHKFYLETRTTEITDSKKNSKHNRSIKANDAQWNPPIESNINNNSNTNAKSQNYLPPSSPSHMRSYDIAYLYSHIY